MFAAVRVRGRVGLNPRIGRTLELLRLHRVNHLVLLGENAKGMLQQAEGFLTWGEIDSKTLALLLEKRGRLSGNKRLTKGFLHEKNFKSFGELAESILNGESALKELGIKPVFRLSPPKSGFERAGIKKPFKIGGALGYRSTDINALIRRMV